jgi:hypothetical protein
MQAMRTMNMNMISISINHVKRFFAGSSRVAVVPEEHPQATTRAYTHTPTLRKVSAASVGIQPAGIGGIALEKPAQITERPSELDEFGVSREEYLQKMALLDECEGGYSKSGRGRLGIAVCVVFFILTFAFRLYVELNWIFFLWVGLGGLFSSIFADRMIVAEMRSFQRDADHIFSVWQPSFGLTVKTKQLHSRQLYFQINFHYHQQQPQQQQQQQ